MTKPARKAERVGLRRLDRSLPMELLKAREAAMARFRPMLREFGLTEQQWRVIRVLAEYGRIDASELARRSMLLAPSLTRILQFLESQGLVRRLADKGDQRRAFLCHIHVSDARFGSLHILNALRQVSNGALSERFCNSNLASAARAVSGSYS